MSRSPRYIDNAMQTIIVVHAPQAAIDTHKGQAGRGGELPGGIDGSPQSGPAVLDSFLRSVSSIGFIDS